MPPATTMAGPPLASRPQYSTSEVMGMPSTTAAVPCAVATTRLRSDLPATSTESPSTDIDTSPRLT
jgi:hypothetical protein